MPRLIEIICTSSLLQLRVVCNPFRNFGTSRQDEQENSNEEDVLNSPKFDQGVKKLVDEFV